MKLLSRKKIKNAAIKLSDSDFHEPKFLNYSDIHSILLLFEADDAEKNLQLKKIVHLLKADGKKVTAIGCLRSKKLKTEFPIFENLTIVDKSMTDFFEKPRHSVFKIIDGNKFDALLDLSLNESIPLQYISLYSNALLKIGIKKTSFPLYDFILDIDSILASLKAEQLSIDLIYIFNQIIFYLKNIQSCDEKA
ncbi:MAG: hypothetical protein KBA43_00270 [Paludibacteraceae bacterium]|nr:hypothetical protein [Paludibacteraceae bacterium]